VAGPSLDALDGPVDPQLGVCLQEHVDVAGHSLHLDDLEMEAICHLPGYLPEALVHAVHQHRPAALRAEDHVVLAAAGDVAIVLVFHAKKYTAKDYLLSLTGRAA